MTAIRSFSIARLHDLPTECFAREAFSYLRFTSDWLTKQSRCFAAKATKILN